MVWIYDLFYSQTLRESLCFDFPWGDHWPVVDMVILASGNVYCNFLLGQPELLPERRSLPYPHRPGRVLLAWLVRTNVAAGGVPTLLFREQRVPGAFAREVGPSADCVPGVMLPGILST